MNTTCSTRAGFLDWHFLLPDYISTVDEPVAVKSQEDQDKSEEQLSSESLNGIAEAETNVHAEEDTAGSKRAAVEARVAARYIAAFEESSLLEDDFSHEQELLKAYVEANGALESGADSTAVSTSAK